MAATRVFRFTGASVAILRGPAPRPHRSVSERTRIARSRRCVPDRYVRQTLGPVFDIDRRANAVTLDAFAAQVRHVGRPCAHRWKRHGVVDFLDHRLRGPKTLGVQPRTRRRRTDVALRPAHLNRWIVDHLGQQAGLAACSTRNSKKCTAWEPHLSKVEDAMIVTLKKNGIILPPEFLHVADNFHPKFPPRH